MSIFSAASDAVTTAMGFAKGETTPGTKITTSNTDVWNNLITTAGGIFNSIIKKDTSLPSGGVVVTSNGAKPIPVEAKSNKKMIIVIGGILIIILFGKVILKFIKRLLR